MKRNRSLGLIGLSALACLLCMVDIPDRAPVLAQSTDDGAFTVYTTIDFDSNNVISAYATDPEPDDYEDLEEWWLDGPTTWQLSGDDYYISGDGQSFSSGGPVPGGFTYTASFYFQVAYYYYSSGDDGDCQYGALEDGTCEGWDYPSGYASTDVPLLPHIANINPSSAYQGDQGTLTVTGSNFIEYSGDQLALNFSGSGNPFILLGTPSTCTSTCTATFSYDFSGYPVGSYALSVTNDEGSSNSVPFTVNSVPPPPDPGAVTSNPQAGYSSIVSTGTVGGSGTMAVSFSGTAFAAISPSVTYGPYSTPSSIAANLAALITQKYFQYGLSAKAFGPNIVYSGNTTLGAVANPTTGPSYTTTTSPAAASETETACDSAPPQQPSAVISMAFWGVKNPSDNLLFAGATTPCSELLGVHSCPTIWDLNLEGTVMVTDDASKWTVNQQKVSGGFAYTFKNSSGNLQSGTYTYPTGPDGPTFLQQAATTRSIFWIDSPGPFNTTTMGNTIDSGTSLQTFSVSVCRKNINPPICATKKWSVYIVVDPGGSLNYSSSFGLVIK